jgi:predicted mannosyl-3-phosphoglycerate phosphatase (HAD superfamily)
LHQPGVFQVRRPAGVHSMQRIAFPGRTGHPLAGEFAAAAGAMVVCAAVNGSWSQAISSPDAEFRTALGLLERTGVPVIAWSTHTRAEIEMVRQQMEIRAPFISENGAALFVPAGYFPFRVDSTRQVTGYEVIEFGPSYETLIATLRRVARGVQVDIVMLADMAIEEVASEFRLGLLGARLAKLREYGELFRVIDQRTASRGRLFRALHGAGLTCSHGDRYDLVTGVSDRAAALHAVHRLMERARGRLVRIGIGSRAEDLPVLTQADVRIVIRDRDAAVTDHIVGQLPTAHVIEQTGLQGWLEAVTRVTSVAFRQPR